MQSRLADTYRAYNRVPASAGRSGGEVARRILDDSGLEAVSVEAVPGFLTDHYDTATKTLFLSTSNHDGGSLAAIGIAAHEAGHAIQDQQGYTPLRVRLSLLSTVETVRCAMLCILLLGLYLGSVSSFYGLLIALAGFLLLVQMLTMHVEWDASHRAIEALGRLELMRDHERGSIRRVLRAAAMTYLSDGLFSFKPSGNEPVPTLQPTRINPGIRDAGDGPAANRP